MTRIGDIVEIPEIKTVIQLKDLQESRLRRMILDSFVVTGEVMTSLEAILTSLNKPEGRGAFLKGHFGSGKSHFLGMLSLLLRQPESWEVLLDQAPSLENIREDLRHRHFLVSEISLIQHRASEFLEDIFTRQIFQELSSRLRRPVEGGGSRLETFEKIRRLMREAGFSGLVLLVDELSEFLRSKTDPHAYNEDIRFLQYLGEETSSFPLWVVASLQEWIEETGEISQDAFNKIKDRYPLRISLGRAHIEELISHRLIRHKEGAESKIREIFQTLRSYFPSFPVEESRFVRLYPVHPATVTLLDRLKPLFSEHRGIVDFIHFRLKGDAERGIPSFLERPALELLGPSVIFDHFIHRIRETAETQPFVEKVFLYYQEEIPRIFRDPDQRKVALEALKLLILFSISPVKHRYTVRHMAEMILFRVTDLETGINYQYLQDILERLAKEGSYLSISPGKDPLDAHFSINLEADVPAILRHKIRQGASEIFPSDRRLFERLASLAESPHLPFAGWAEQGQQRVTVLWEYTRRSGQILLRQVDEIPFTQLERLADESGRTEEDFFLIVATTRRVEAQQQHLRQVLLPALRERYQGAFLFWIPASLGEEEEAWFRELLAIVLLAERYREDHSETGRRAREYLQGLLNEGRKKLGEILNRAYFQGLLVWDDRRVETSAYGYLSMEKFLQEFIPPLLSRRFPRHHRIHPYLEALSPTTIPNLLRDFFATGTLEVDERSRFGLRVVLDGLLKPMGLIKKKGNQYLLQVDPRHNELAEHFLSLLEKGPLPPEEIYWALRKGEYGLSRNQFEILVLALLFSGNIIANQGQRKKGLEDISRTGLQGITAIGKGEILREDLRAVIASHPLIPDKFRKGSITLPSQEELWGGIKAQKEREMESLRNILQRARWASSFHAFQNLPWDSFARDIQDVLTQWEEVKVSFPAREGLERFLSAAAQEPFLGEKISHIEDLKTFFEYAERVLFVHQYLNDQRLFIPENPSYNSLREEMKELRSFFEAGRISITQESIQKLLQRFQNFREEYVQLYAREHRRARSGDQFASYEKLRGSRRYQLLCRIDHLEMISVRHNRNSVDRILTSVLYSQCNGPSLDALQATPVCSCGYRLGEEITFIPTGEIEEAIDLGIRETLEALNTTPYQEKLISYLAGLEEIGEKEKASAIRKVLSLHPLTDETSFVKLEDALTPLAIQGINEAFRGRVVVVRRDLDQLYAALIHRKYSLSQARKIMQQWLKEEEIAEGAFVQFTGKGETDYNVSRSEELMAFIDSRFSHLLPLLREIGQGLFQKALLVALWIEGYGIPSSNILSLFPFLEKGEERGNLLVQQLSLAARELQEKEGSLFERMAGEVEREEGLFAELWKLLAPRTAFDIFQQEVIFPSLLREAFERLLASPEMGGEVTGMPAESSGFWTKKREMIMAIGAYNTLRQKVSSLKKKEANPPQDFQKWESTYCEQLSPLAFLRATFPSQAGRFEVSLPAPARDCLAGAEGIQDSLSGAFSRFYRQNLPEWESGAVKGPRMIEDLPSLGQKKGSLPKKARRIYLLLDGMRWDMWEYVKENFFGRMAGQLRIIQEGALWAHLPSSTARQMEILQASLEKESSKGEEGDEKIWKIEGIDERVHTERGTLEHLFRNVLQYLQLELAPRLLELPPQSLLILFSDHGFVENPHFEKSDKYRSSRYLHGEDSPFEIIVPWAILTRI